MTTKSASGVKSFSRPGIPGVFQLLAKPTTVARTAFSSVVCFATPLLAAARAKHPAITCMSRIGASVAHDEIIAWLLFARKELAGSRAAQLRPAG